MIPAPPPEIEQPQIDDDSLRTALKKLVFDDVLKDIDQDQSAILSQASKMDLYWRGKQHLVLDSSGGAVQWVPADDQTRLQYNKSTGNEAQRTYNYVMNIYRGDGKKFIGEYMPPL